MKKFELKKEILIWIIVLLPLVYLAYVWNTLPQIVPTHFGIDGQPNDWSSKTTLIYLVGGLGIGIYILMTVIPSIDPKRKIEAMGNKYFLFKMILMLFMSCISFFIIHSAIAKSTSNDHSIYLLLGAMFVFLGNFMQTVKPNYFIGIRTPWTLENETIWRKTHLLGGRLFFVAGLLVMILSFIVKAEFYAALMAIIITASLIPIIYSFLLYRQEKK